MPPQDATAVQVTALGISVTCNIAGDRQLVLQQHVEAGAPLEAKNALIDEAMGIVDRLKARYDLETEEREFRRIGITLSTFINGLSIAGSNVDARREETAKIVADIAQNRDGVRTDGYNQHVATGRTGVYKPSGHVLSRMEALSRDIAKARADLEAYEKSEVENRSKCVESIKRYQDDLKERRERLNAMRRRAGFANDNDEFIEQERFQAEP